MGKLVIEYLLSDAGRKDSLLKGGDGKRRQKIETILTPKIINLNFIKIDDSGNSYLNIGFGENSFKPFVNNLSLVNKYGKYVIEKDNSVVEFDTIQTVESLLEWESKRLAKIKKQQEEFEPQLEELNKEYNLKMQKEREENEKRQIAKKEAAKKQQEEKQRLEEEKSAWIEQNGSNHLKRAFALGHNCQRQYIIERASIEFPDFEVDFDDRAEWQNRSFPSIEAIELTEKLIEQEYNAEIVWLTNPVWELEYDDEFEKCEAIIIRNYLGKCDLVKIIE